MKNLLISILWILPIFGICIVNATEYPAEMVEAYEWAYENWIIWESSIDDATLYDTLPNPEMRAILLNFSEYLWLDSDLIAESFGDLFIDEGSSTNRANFGTALSRILRWDKYDWGNPYYQNHLEALKAAWIMNQIDNPEDRVEIKWYVLIMLNNNKNIEVIKDKDTEDGNIINCEDALVKQACQGLDIDDFETCPEICRPNGILTNNLTKTVEFKANENNTKIVFNWTYKALKDWTIERFKLEHDNIDRENCRNNMSFNDIIYKIYINWELVWSTLNPNNNAIVLNTCQYLWNIILNKTINIRKWESVQIKIEWELSSSDFWDNDKAYNYEIKLSLYEKEQEEDAIDTENLAPIRIIETNAKCKGMDKANVYHSVKNGTINLRRDIVDGDYVQIFLYNPINEKYQSLWTTKMSDKLFRYQAKREGEHNFLLKNWCDEYNYKINIKTGIEQQDTSDYWTISISNPNNPSEIITIMDRNLWATSNDIKNPKSYGYYYQRWNNYGFPWNETINTTTNKAIRDNKYNNKWSYNSKFIKQSSYWEDEDLFVFHDWLWWWINDSNKNNRWAFLNNHEDRQWPCPEWWHVPSAWEWWLLIKYYIETYEKNTKLYEGDSSSVSIWGSWLYYFSDEDTRLKFQQYFKIPLAGYINWSNGSLEHVGGFWNYRSSSSIKDSSNTISFTLRIADVWKNNWYWIRTEWESIRCFKNKETNKNINQEIINKEDTKEYTNENDIQTWSGLNNNNWNPLEKLSNWYTKEMNDAYKFAHNNWITTINNIENANMNWWLTRIAMAKMLSQYAMNILWKTPDTSKWTPKFNDVTEKQNSDYNNAVTLSYQLWIMWQNMKNNKFRPNDEVTRAEFTTALSRMLYNIEDGKWDTKYYEPHITKLYNEWVISNRNPDMKEKRWYVMLMLMRSVK